LANVIEGRGGIKYLRAYLQKNPEANVDMAGAARENLLESLPAPAVRPIVFLGDSLTAGGEWWELFNHRQVILNRGIGGDTSAGVLKRVPAVLKLHPKAVFLMIGTNDGQLLGYAPADTLRNYRLILDQIRRASPDTHVYLESLIPSRTPKFNRWSEAVNDSLRQFDDGRAVHFVNLRGAFMDSDHLLNQRYTFDGLHLNAQGYEVWKSQLDPVIDRIASPMAHL
jgi:lysophospholipase L1-like esterase